MTRSFTKLFSAVLLIALCSLSSLSAQSVDIEWGEAMEREHFILSTLGQAKTGVYALAIRYDNLFLEYYEGNKLALKFSKEIVLPKIDSIRLKVRKVLFLKGQLSVIAYSQHKSILKVYGFLMGRDGEIQPKPVEIFNFGSKKKDEDEAFKIRISRDNSKILVYSKAYHLPNKEWASSICVLNPQLDILKEITESLQARILKGYIKNNGAVYMAIKQKGNLIVRQYEPANNFERQDINVDFPELQISSLSLTEDAQGNIISAGFYGKKRKKRINLGGTFFFKIDHIKVKMVISKTTAFGNELLESMLAKKQNEKGHWIPNRFYPKHLIAKANGGLVMIGEYKDVWVYSSDGIPTSRTTVYRSIIVVDITAQGKTNWVRSIIKKQKSSIRIVPEALSFLIMTKDRSNYHSFILAMRGNKIYLIYNDNKENLEIISALKMKVLIGKKKAVPVVVTIDPTGKMKKELYKGGKEEVILIPFASSQKSYKNVIIHGSRGKEKKFGRLILK